MAAAPPSAKLRAQLRKQILARVEQLHLGRAEAAAELGLTYPQMSRLANGDDIFTLDRLADAAASIGLKLELRATRPYS